MVCKKRKRNPIPQRMADLPPARRAIDSPPFSNTGVDFFVPIHVKVLRSRAKRWGCLFTCLKTRAVHLEVAESLESDSFINTLERFINRRGIPLKIYSDNGTNFKGAERELREELLKLKEEDVGNFAARKGFTWNFNPPEAPHMGGAWERMIKSVKDTLKIILKDQLVNDYTLMTVFTLVNSRPVMHDSNDINDLEALTPNHFLLGRASLNLSPAIIYHDDVNHRRRWKRAQALTNQFWRRWLLEYLPTISTRPKWHNSEVNVEIGDLALLVEKEVPRGKWLLARVIKLHPGDDNIVRVVDVKTKNGNFRRPITKLCLLK